MTEEKTIQATGILLEIRKPVRDKMPWKIMMEDLSGNSAEFATWSAKIVGDLTDALEKAGETGLRLKIKGKASMWQGKPSYTLESAEIVGNTAVLGATKPENRSLPEQKRVDPDGKTGPEKEPGLEKSMEIPIDYRDSAELSMKDALYLISRYQGWFRKFEISNDEAFRTIFGTIAIQRGKETYQRRSEKARGINDES